MRITIQTDGVEIVVDEIDENGLDITCGPDAAAVIVARFPAAIAALADVLSEVIEDGS